MLAHMGQLFNYFDGENEVRRDKNMYQKVLRPKIGTFWGWVSRF